MDENNKEEVKDAHIEQNENELSDNQDAEQKVSLEKKKTKNLVSLVILLAGLLAGSVFVDVAQLVKGSGVSQRALNKTDAFEMNGKTWVAYSDPIVKVNVISDDNCEECQPDEVLVWLRRMVPTIMSAKIDYNSEEGKRILEGSGAKSIPVFAFSSEIENTDFYGQAQMLFNKKGDYYILDTARLGAPAGKYTELPKINEDDVKIGDENSKIKLIVFSDFQCPYSKAFNSVAQKALEEYKDKILYVFKQLPLTSLHPKAVDAALASECANEQGEFLKYSNKLFENQKDWSRSDGTQEFKAYARQMGLDAGQFNQCLDDKKYQEKIDEDSRTAEEFGISGTPAVFINGQFKSGAAGYDTVKKIIDEELGK